MSSPSDSTRPSTSDNAASLTSKIASKSPSPSPIEEDYSLHDLRTWQIMKSSIVAAFKQNAKAGFVLQAFAVLILILYFTVPAIESAFDQIGNFKSQYGFLYSGISTMIVGGSLPYLLLYLRERKLDARYHNHWFVFKHFLFVSIFWLYTGVEVDGFYRLQAIMFGSDNSAGTLICKVAVDQFVYNPFWGVWRSIIPYQWNQLEFSFPDTVRLLRGKKLYYIDFPTTLFTVWIVWLPAVTIIYALPSSLQVPMFNLVTFFWALLLSFLMKKEKDDLPPLTGGVIEDEETVEPSVSACSVIKLSDHEDKD